MRRARLLTLTLPLLLAACGASELPGQDTAAPTAGATGELLVAVSPDTASIVAVNGAVSYALKSGVPMGVPAGTYAVTLSATGYATVTASQTVADGKSSAGAYALQRTP